MASRQKLRQAVRCEKLADHLAALPKREYGHGAFIREVENEDFCGTVCCALGHAASVRDQKFPGLLVTIDRSRSWPRLDWEDGASLVQRADAYFGPDAYNRIFSDTDETYNLDSDHVTVGMVVKRLRKFAADLKR